MAHKVTGITLRNRVARCWWRTIRGLWRDNWLLSATPKMQNLRQLRLILHKGSEDAQAWEQRDIYMAFGPEKTPSLEVLELDVESNLEFCIDPVLPLKTLVVTTKKALRLAKLMLGQAPVTTLNQIYFESRVSFVPDSSSSAYSRAMDLQAPPAEGT